MRVDKALELANRFKEGEIVDYDLRGAVMSLADEVLTVRNQRDKIWCEMVEGEKDLHVIIRNLREEVKNYRELINRYEDDLK